MRLVSLKIWKYQEGQSLQLCDFENLQFIQFFQRSTAREQLQFHSRTIVDHTEPGKRQTVKLEGNVGYCHTWIHPSGVACTAVTDNEYPLRVAYTLISDAITAFLKQYPNNEASRQTADTSMPFQEGQALFDKFQNPDEADKITKIEKELDEVKATVIKSMDDILKRGENLDSLMQKSGDLSATSYQFYKTAQKNNQCCSSFS
ncbi:unnamed protein product [Amoebophrya sp. A120]|nr:unnamed protein product [Amoebophrya sp. A120]|eukprot:GSA120T00017530001.1